jgi:hypothetical protein
MDASSRMAVTPITFAKFIGRLFGTQRSRQQFIAYSPTKLKKTGGISARIIEVSAPIRL